MPDTTTSFTARERYLEATRNKETNPKLKKEAGRLSDGQLDPFRQRRSSDALTEASATVEEESVNIESIDVDDVDVDDVDRSSSPISVVSLDEEENTKEKAATNIQRGFRGHLARGEAERRRDAVETIQNTARDYIGRKRVAVEMAREDEEERIRVEEQRRAEERQREEEERAKPEPTRPKSFVERVSKVEKHYKTASFSALKGRVVPDTINADFLGKTVADFLSEWRKRSGRIGKFDISAVSHESSAGKEVYRCMSEFNGATEKQAIDALNRALESKNAGIIFSKNDRSIECQTTKTDDSGFALDEALSEALQHHPRNRSGASR